MAEEGLLEDAFPSPKLSACFAFSNRSFST
jgi:hypothetical protein